MALFSSYVKDQSGITAMEYAFVASLIALAALIGIRVLGGAVHDKYSNINNAVTKAGK